jgi:peptidoglycan hydrolase CwlO-like protein
MQRTEVQKKIDSLMRESKNLKMSISQLKEKLSRRHDNFALPQAEINDFGPR